MKDQPTTKRPDDKWENISKHPEKNWPEDYGQENGNYQNKCHDCGELFMGNKHRVWCKECEIPSERYWKRVSLRQKPEDNKCAHAGCWGEGEMVGFARCMVNEVFPLKSMLSHRDAEIAELKELMREILLDDEGFIRPNHRSGVSWNDQMKIRSLLSKTK